MNQIVLIEEPNLSAKKNNNNNNNLFSFTFQEDINEKDGLEEKLTEIGSEINNNDTYDEQPRLLSVGKASNRKELSFFGEDLHGEVTIIIINHKNI